MTDKKVWLITGASRGIGVNFAQAAHSTAKLARALVTIAGQQPPLRRFIASASAEQKVQDLQEQINAYLDLSTSLAWEEVEPCG